MVFNRGALLDPFLTLFTDLAIGWLMECIDIPPSFVVTTFCIVRYFLHNIKSKHNYILFSKQWNYQSYILKNRFSYSSLVKTQQPLGQFANVCGSRRKLAPNAPISLTNSLSSRGHRLAP